MSSSSSHNPGPRERGRINPDKYEKATGARIRYHWRIRIRTAAHVDSWLRECFGSLHIAHEEGGTSIIWGDLVDLPQVYGVILQMRDSHIELLSLRTERVTDDRQRGDRTSG